MGKILFNLLLLTQFLYSTTYYIDYENGFDSNNGLSTSQAWRHCPWDDDASGNASSTSLSPGDSLIFKRDITYIGYFTVRHSGTQRNPIYIGSVSSWGNGNHAIINANGASGRVINVSTHDDLVFDALEITGAQLSSSTEYGIGTTSRGTLRIEIKNCYIHHNRSRNIYFPHGTSILIHDNECSNDIYGAAGSTGTQIWVVSDATSWNTACKIYNNEVYDGDCDAMTFHGTYIEIYNNFVYEHNNGPAHADGIVCNGLWYDTRITENIRIYNNLVVNSGQMIYLDACSSNRTIRNVWIYNNICYETADYSRGGDHPTPIGIVLAHGSGGYDSLIYIYNNSIYNTFEGIVLGGFNGSKIYVKNNIMHNTKTGGDFCFMWSSSGTKTDIDIDYNQYHAYNDRSRSVQYRGTNLTFAQWRGSPYNREVNGQEGDPLYSSPPSDFTLQSNSPCIDKGIDELSAIFSVDRLGVSRPQGSAWDIGAYESLNNGSHPSSVNGLRIKK